MAMDSDTDGRSRRETIAGVISAELERQAQQGAIRVDVDALAAAIETAIAAEEPVEALMGEGRHPEELNATNDD
jgi:hypothetical protein